MNTYKVGDGPQSIDLSVNITTIGLAGTRANAGKPGNTPVPVAHSVDVTGDILPNQSIGTAGGLKGSVLIISTMIDLQIVGDQEARKKEYDRLTVKYTLANGTEGPAVYDKPDNKVASDDFKTVILVKQVELI